MNRKFPVIVLIFLLSSVIESQINQTESQRKAFLQAFNLPDDQQPVQNLRTQSKDIKPRQPSLAQKEYEAIRQFALQNNYPKKVIMRKSDNEIFLVEKSSSSEIFLLRVGKVVNKDVVLRLFNPNQLIMHVPADLMSNIPISKRSLSSDVRLIKISGSDTVFLQSDGQKRPINPQNFKQFGFDPQKVEIVTQRYLQSLPNGELLN